MDPSNADAGQQEMDPINLHSVADLSVNKTLCVAEEQGTCSGEPKTDSVDGDTEFISCPPKPTKFEVDVNKIESVTVEDQDADIQALGLTVYDQSALERGILDQVEKETRKREAQEELVTVSSKLKLAEEQLKRVESASGCKRSILQVALEEPTRKKPTSNAVKKHEGVAQEKVKELRLKKAELQAQLNNKGLSKKEESKEESERDRKIRMGEMTPFGTSVNAASSDLNSFEKYLKSQQELHKKMLSSGTVKKKISASKATKSDKVSQHMTSNKKSLNNPVLPKKVLFPKKQKSKESLNTYISVAKSDLLASPGKTPAETAVLKFEDSGSEYLPSQSDDDADFYPESPEKRRGLSSLPKADKHSSPQSSKKRSGSDRWAGGSLKRHKKKSKVSLNGDPEEWGSDDSDWICTDDEDFSSDNETGKKTKRNSKRERDDGNSEDFYRRIKKWEKQNEGLQDQLEEDVHEFENGYKISNFIWNKLYTYQQVGVRWMWELNQQRCGGILGDEMGLGKTIQIISFLAGLSISKIKCRTTGYRGLGPTLIVCPTTVMHQWVHEFHTWFPPLRIAILHESGSYAGTRSQLVRDILHEKGVIITSYTAVVRLQKYLLHQHWHYVILDEGHKIRNPDAQVTLAAKQLRTPHRLILSGSPLQNNLRELWSLLDFVFPGKLGTLPVFMSEFAVPISQGGYSNASEVMVATAFKCATVLRDTIAPYLLRRMKADVSDHIKLPSKNEQVLFCRLTDDQRELYKAYLQCGEVGRILEKRCQIFVGLINLRKICNHPHLYSGGPKLFSHEKEEDLPAEERFGYWEKAGKMVVIEALLKMWHKQEHRVLIFTQSRQMLLIMEKFVNDKGYSYLKLDGGTSIAARQPLIKKFNQDKSYFVMLLTTKVGGLGVNLTGANRVVIYDPDWNPATDTQARERAWRIGQQNAVTVYRLITAGTIEEKMYHRQIFKQFLCNKVLKDPRQRRFFKSNDLLELFTLKETDDSTTETAAIFAGTNSQVQVKPKNEHRKNARDKKQCSDSHHSLKGRYEKIGDTVENNRSGNVKTPEQSTKISFSQDKLENMKKLAHELSLKLSNKVAASTKDNVKVNEQPLDTASVSLGEGLTSRSEGAIDKVEEKATGNDLIDKQIEVKTEPMENIETGDVEAQSNQHMIIEECNEENKSNDEYFCNASSSGEDLLTKAVIEDDSDEDLEDMKQLAQELGKELSQKVMAAAALNKPKASFIDVAQECNRQPGVNQDGSSSTVSKLTASDICDKVGGSSLTTPECSSPCSQEATLTSENSLSNSLSSTQESRPHSNLFLINKISPKSSDKNRRDHDKASSSRHKKSKKIRKHKYRDAIFEGERVRGLVKSSALEVEKSKEEMDAEASHNSKQDDYVLRKLFAKTGIKTAMQHDKVMESGHADYVLVEGEARRVAQDAVKAMKASRQQCWNPMSGQPTWTGASGTIRATGEDINKPQSSRPKFGKKKAQKSVSKDPEAVEDTGSSSLLARIRARNLLLNEDDGDATSGPPPSVSDVNKDLLDDIRTFVAFGASVDGRATTDEIINQFRDRLPVETSALFKQLLMQICEFHRLPSGQGTWKLIPDFKW